MARPPRSSDPRRGGDPRRSGDVRRGGSASASRRPGEASGPIRRAPQRAGGQAVDPSRRQPPQRRTPSRERDRPVPASARQTSTRSAQAGSGQPGRVGTTAHPEAHRLTTRTDLSETVLGPKNYTPRRIGLLAAIAIVLLVTVSFPLRNHYQYLSDQKAVAQEKAALEKTIAELEAEERQLADPAYIEQQARIRFGAVKPGETPYRVSQVDPVEKAAAEQAAAELAAQSWQTRVWSSISEQRDPVMPEGSSMPGAGVPGGAAGTGVRPQVPGADAGIAPEAGVPGAGAAGAPQPGG